MKPSTKIGRMEALKHAAFWSLVAVAFAAIVICNVVKLAFCDEEDPADGN